METYLIQKFIPYLERIINDVATNNLNFVYNLNYDDIIANFKMAKRRDKDVLFNASLYLEEKGISVKVFNAETNRMNKSYLHWFEKGDIVYFQLNKYYKKEISQGTTKSNKSTSINISYIIPITNELKSKTISYQEQVFYSVAKELFPDCLISSNISLSQVVDLKGIKSDLTVEEIDYYFTSSLDCVIFDLKNKCKPMYLFELDSSYHDRKYQIKNDSKKNRILSLAGLGLYRLRKTEGNFSKDDFYKIFQDIKQQNI